MDFNISIKIFQVKQQVFQSSILPDLRIEKQLVFNKIFKELENDQRITLLPFYLQNVAGIRELNQTNQLHPNIEGMKVVAKNIWESLRDLID